MTKPTLVLDLYGVVHSNTSGGADPTVISDPPVDGAIEFIIAASDHFMVHRIILWLPYFHRGRTNLVVKKRCLNGLRIIGSITDLMGLNPGRNLMLFNGRRQSPRPF